MKNSTARSDLSIMAAVNRVIDELHGSLGVDDSDFFCECGHIGCRSRITLTRAEYADLREHHRPVLLAGHAHRRPGVAQSHDFGVAARA